MDLYHDGAISGSTSTLTAERHLWRSKSFVSWLSGRSLQWPRQGHL
uniref:Uncharacterized protein n=1 Tax=Anguilla anguilla TaxID=7936 RepID=A0A0E9RRI3_ANGAN